ncbi:MAG: A/G-specific adenine glycosylase [Thermodesulfobacteriota bacterium]|nr:A/G-specific adenine glycosylase [Thermodesulfobacteriota bacterium]
MHPITAIPEFQQQLLCWFTTHQRALPWRVHYRPYHVWISEVMGQQTQMDRVVDYFNRWQEQFPDIFSVANAPEQRLLKAWEGLGYYSRARNIQKTARILVREYGAELPADYNALMSLPGIGPYTAAAIMSIAFNGPYPVLDANVERILCRIADLDKPAKHTITRLQLQQLTGELLPDGNARNFNQALMELGALVCKPKNPHCDACPVRNHCHALATDTVDLRPVPVKKEQKIDITMSCALIFHADRLFIQQRLPDDVWGGLWEFPGGRLKEGETPEQAAKREVYEETEFKIIDLQPFATVVHHYTKYRVKLHSFCCRLSQEKAIPVLHAASHCHWVTVDELEGYPFPSGHRQLISKLRD